MLGSKGIRNIAGLPRISKAWPFGISKACSFAVSALATQTRSIREQVSSGRGFSIIELLVVVAIFAIVALMATQALIHSLRGAKKSESLARVRSDLDFALAVIERNLHNATDINPPCMGAATDTVSYTDGFGSTTSFSCDDIDGSGGLIGYIASASARLTSDEVDVTSCSFVCTPGDVGVPPSVTVSVIAEDPNAIGAEGAQVTTDTKILLRIY